MRKNEKLALWDFLENCLKLALRECTSTLPLEDVNEVIEKIDNREYLIALQSLSYYFVDKKINFSKAASNYIRKAAITIGINEENHDEYWLWEKIEPLLTNEKVMMQPAQKRNAANLP
jgi:hypothetical protein